MFDFSPKLWIPLVLPSNASKRHRVTKLKVIPDIEDEKVFNQVCILDKLRKVMVFFILCCLYYNGFSNVMSTICTSISLSSYKTLEADVGGC